MHCNEMYFIHCFNLDLGVCNKRLYMQFSVVIWNNYQDYSFEVFKCKIPL